MIFIAVPLQRKDGFTFPALFVQTAVHSIHLRQSGNKITTKAMKTSAIHQFSHRGLVFTVLILVGLCFSLNAIAFSGRGGEGRFGGNIGGRGEAAAPSTTRDGYGHRLPGVVTANEEGGKIPGHAYDPDDVDLTEAALHRNEYASVSNGRLVRWISQTDAYASEAAAYRAGNFRTLVTLAGLTVLAIVLSIAAFR